MTSVSFWQNAISLYFASFCTPRPNLPVTAGVSWLPTFAFHPPIKKRTTFLGVISKILQVFIEPFNSSFFSNTGQGIDLDYRDIEWFALETNRDHSVNFEIASKYCILDSFVDYDGYAILLRDSFPQQQIYWSSELELDMKQHTGSKQEKEYVQAVYCHLLI